MFLTMNQDPDPFSKALMLSLQKVLTMSVIMGWISLTKILMLSIISSVQFIYSVVFDSLWPHRLQHAGSLPITNSQSLLKLMSIQSVMPSNHLILCCPPSPAALNLFSIRAFSSESALHIRWPKYWSFSFSISPSNECSGLIFFMIDWFDLLAVQGTPQESSPTPQFKSINSLVLSFLYCPALTSINTWLLEKP